MNYPEYINEKLKFNENNIFTAIDLFAGCGGLALGFEAAGFKTIGYEMVKDYYLTYINNIKSKCYNEKLTTDSDIEVGDIIIGGPPCQPFSVGGKQLGFEDSRDGMRIYANIIKKYKPKLWILENVRGLLYKNKWYLLQIISELENEGYTVDARLLNAKNYDVPQNRERLIVVGHKGGFCFPEVINDIKTVGDAIGDIVNKETENWKYLTSNQDRYIKKYEIASKCIKPRDLDLLKQARTLTCRNLAGATGDMQRIKTSNGRRRLTVREAARLQSFPDWFNFYGKDQSIFTQIGNAVPPMLAYHLALSVKNYLEGSNEKLSHSVLFN